jgi:signal transduction histidine kinase
MLCESEQLLLRHHKMEGYRRLAAGVAHEINNPLAIINEKAGLMKDLWSCLQIWTGRKKSFSPCLVQYLKV